MFLTVLLITGLLGTLHHPTPPLLKKKKLPGTSMSWKERDMYWMKKKKKEGRNLAPIFHVYNVQHVLKETALELIIWLTAGGQGWRSIHFNKPSTRNQKIIMVIQPYIYTYSLYKSENKLCSPSLKRYLFWFSAVWYCWTVLQNEYVV